MNEITNRDKNNFKWVGKNTQRPDGPDKVTGRARYGDDMIVPGMLHGKTLRSPHAHAKIISIDTSEAEALSGVKAVVTYKDIPDHPLLAPPYGPMITDFHDISRNIMARDKVFYDGHPVAAVAATSERIAKAALLLIRVEYEILPHVLDPFEAAGADAPILHDYQYTLGSDPKSSKPSNVFRVASSERGDLSKGFAEAEIIVEREFRSQPVHQGYIEPQALVATAAADGSVDLWTTTQGHFVIRGYCARLLNMDMSSIRVTASEIGGGFGGKNNLYSEPVAIRLSQKTGRPVRFVMTRSEVFRATGPASGTYSHLRIGAKKDGTIVAAEATIYNQAGAFKGSPVGRSVDTFFSAYSIKNAKATAYDVCVNRPKVAAYRAPGAPMAALGAELAINELAAKLAIDPIEIRLKNAVQDHEQSLSGVKFGRIGLNEVLVKAREHPHYSAALAENQGRGFALGYWMHGGGLSSVNANLLDDGTVTIATGNPDIGGSRSSMRVMAAEELGVDISLIKTIIADTASIGYSHLTAGSRTTFATGLAVINSVREIIDKLRQLAATKWDVPVENVAWEAGQAVCHHGDFQALSLKQLASLAPKVGGAIAGH